jgi:hypothetical protein
MPDEFEKPTSQAVIVVLSGKLNDEESTVVVR